MKIAIVYGNDGSDVRIAKTCRTLVGLGHQVHFIGWDRRPDVAKEAGLPGVTSHVVRHAVPRLRWTVSGQIAFTRHAVRALRRLKPDVVCAVNEDNVLRVGWLRGLSYRKLVCDVFDSHVDRATGKAWPVRLVSWLMTVSTRWWSDRLIATDDVRYETFGRFRPRTTVVGNYPPDPGPELSRRTPAGPPKVFVSGTLARARGLDVLVAAAERSPDLAIVAAGWAADEFASEVFLKHPAVEFLGHVTPRQSLELAAGCDAVLATYAPICRNHILASPNKIYDAISVGRPVIINEEALVSRWVNENGVGFVCPYHDAVALAGFLNSLVERRTTLPEFARHARTVFENGYSWEAMEERLARLYATLDPDRSGPAIERQDTGPEDRLRRAA